MLTNKKTLLALSVASVFVLSGCNDNDKDVVPPVVVPPVVVAPDAPTELSVVVNANVVDSVTNDAIAAKVTFFENGVASENIVDVDGNELTSVDLADGSLAFTVKDDANISEVTVNVSADDYIGKSFIVDLTTAEGVMSVNALLALVSESADGISNKSVVSTVEAGGTTSAVISAATDPGKSSASASVPAGVILYDASEQPVSGEITLKVNGADSSTGAASSIVPAGLNNADATSIVKSVGVANVTMADGTGKKVKKFSDPITVSMTIPATTMLNGEAIQPGDMLGLKSHNEDTGVWASETNKVEVGALNAQTNTYTGTFKTTHLTFFASTVSAPICTDGIAVNLSGDAVPASGLYVSMSSSDASATSYLRANAASNVIVSPLNTKRFGISANAKATVKVFDVNGTPWFTSDGEVNVCGTAAVVLANPATLVNEDFAVTAACANDTTKTVDMSNAVVSYSLAGKAKTLASGTAGTFTLADLVEGSTYNVFVNARTPLVGDTTKATTTITADGTAESLALEVVCQTTTGTTGSGS
ncbi:hypothetical protein HH219_10590 [Pseudoalteromonas sp. NEC-BIFX-2020_015]|uniref:hypothetical protein n=1 Tax=Pseudoalteromonas sp. NEC-BIFX-2020_015 TaxID=2729544 RepID=UPI001461604E|nr:hypothetical protein [Pseudoalteromonas sp. NEC-BIFX-2020_015]NMR25973.1 hypothetical protein [Pseudoalteromonas sp. NEC-BIFX-2020_015]